MAQRGAARRSERPGDDRAELPGPGVFEVLVTREPDDAGAGALLSASLAALDGERTPAPTHAMDRYRTVAP